MAAARKKVVVKLAGDSLAWGYLPPSGFVLPDASGIDQIELIEIDAHTKSIAVNDIVAILYVKDFNLDDRREPERFGRRSFSLRPKGEGLWIRLEFHEMAPLEGLVTVDMAFVDELIADKGLFLTPPDGRSNTVKVFVPRSSIRSLEVLGWVSSPRKKLSAKIAKQRELAIQAGLFEERDE